MPSCWSRSKSAIRVIWVWTRRVRVCRGRIGRTGNGTADDGTRRDAGGDAAPTSPVTAPVITASVATTADVDVAVDVDVAAVHVAAVDVGTVEVAAVDVGAVEVAAVRAGATEVASAGTGPGTATGASTAAAGASTAAAASTAATGASTATASPPPLAQRHICPLRRGGGDIATYAAAPGSRSGGRPGSHQSDQDDRRHVKQTLGHRCGLTRCVGSELLSGSRLDGAGVGFVDTWPAPYREYTRRPEQRETIERDSSTRICQLERLGYGTSISQRLKRPPMPRPRKCLRRQIFLATGATR